MPVASIFAFLENCPVVILYLVIYVVRSKKTKSHKSELCLMTNPAPLLPVSPKAVAHTSVSQKIHTVVSIGNSLRRVPMLLILTLLMLLMPFVILSDAIYMAGLFLSIDDDIADQINIMSYSI